MSVSAAKYIVAADMLKCVVCGRQVVSYSANNERIVGIDGSKAAIGGVFCIDCGLDLDENGLFPEERSCLVKGKNESPGL